MASLYVHVPFRQRQRRYDDSYCVAVDSNRSSVPAYVEAVCSELRFYAREYAAEDGIRSVYAGGGRPSMLPLDEVRTIVTTISDLFDTSAIAEATAEVNPADASASYLRGLSTLGFTRLSLPVLSFFPGALQAVDAPHSAADAIRAIRLAHQSDFDRFSVELHFGWPGSSVERWKASLQQAVDLRVPHIAISEWTGPEGTSEDDAENVQAAKCLSYAMSFLEDCGYEQYELTHFARPGHRSAHHESTYAHESQLGVGPSAHSFWWSKRWEAVPARRWTNVRDLDRYVELLRRSYRPVTYRQSLSWPDLAREYIALRLRTRDGLDPARLRLRYGLDLEAEHGALLATLNEKGLVERTGDPAASGDGAPSEVAPIRLTRRGRLVTDSIVERLVVG